MDERFHAKPRLASPLRVTTPQAVFRAIMIFFFKFLNKVISDSYVLKNGIQAVSLKIYTIGMSNNDIIMIILILIMVMMIILTL